MSVRNLDPELLRAFVTVADQLSFTRAASALNRSQAAVSLQVKRLEDRLGAALLHRSTTKVELSAAGRGFLIDARRILNLCDESLARLAAHRLAGRVRIGVMEDYGTRLLPRLLAEARRRYPLIEVEVEIGLTSRMLRRLGSSFDIVIAMHPTGATEGELVRREEALWVAASGHGTETLTPLPVALAAPGCLFREWAIRAMDAAGFAWRPAFMSQSLAAVEAIVREGLAVTVVKSSMIAPGLRAVRSLSLRVPLPAAEIRMHRAPGLTRSAALVVEHLEAGLRAGGSSVSSGAGPEAAAEGRMSARSP